MTRNLPSIQKSAIRRLLLGIGAALLIGGWGTTRYAHEQVSLRQSQETVSEILRSTGWHKGTKRSDSETRTIPTKHIYAAGVIGMALGAGLIGFALPRLKVADKQ